VLMHVSRRTSLKRARNTLRKRIGDEQMQRIHFLMDLEGAKEEGEMEQAGPPPADSAE